MKPNSKASYILKITRSIAKMEEFNVLPENRNLPLEYPEKLFTLVIGLLGDISKYIIDSFREKESVEVNEEYVRFCAIFFDSYKNTNRLKDLDNYYLLVGAIAYYFSNLPGSATVLLQIIDKSTFNLNAQNIEDVLYWILNGEYDSIENVSESFYCSELNVILTEFQEYFKTGDERIKKLLSECDKFQKKVYQEGTPRELFLGDFLYAIIILKIQNSSWKNLPAFSELSKEIWFPIIKKRGFIKELWPSQMQLGKDGAFKGESVVVQMPTSAGKTKSTELIIRSAFLSNRTNFAVIVAPFRALCHELKNDFYKCFRGERNISIDDINDAFISGDVPAFQDGKKHIIVLTPEKLYYLLTQQTDFVTKIGLVVYDEGHQFDTGSRGVTYELLLTELKSMFNPNVQIVLISAVMSNANEIAQWLSPSCKVVSGAIKLPTQRSMACVDGSSLYFFRSQGVDDFEFYAPKIINQKSLPLKGREKIVRKFPDLSKPSSIAFYLALSRVQNDSVAIFMGTKKMVKTLLEDIVDYFERLPKEISPPFDVEEKRKILTLVRENFGEDYILFKSIKLGVLPHHADVPQGVRLCVENEIHEGLAKFLVCTSTLAQGVNLPIKYLFIPSIRQGKNKIKVRDFHNLIGRVARAGKLTEGSIIFTDPAVLGDWAMKNEVNNLIKLDNTEECRSSLLELLNENILSVYDTNTKRSYHCQFSTKEWLDIFEKNISALNFANEICLRKKIESESVKKDFRIIIERIYGYLETIENFLLNKAESLRDLNSEELAESTLAYMLADESGKENLKMIFSRLKTRIENLGIDSSKMKVLSKTLKGVNRARELDAFVQENKENLKNIESCVDFIKIISPLFTEKFFSKKVFCAYPNRNLLFEAICCWTNGNSYQYLFDRLKKEKIGKYNFTMEMCSEIFDECLSYDGPILINAIVEMLEIDSDTREKYEWYQKQIKYGLPSKESIILYEIGFCDRMLAQKMALLFKNIVNRKDMVLQLIQQEAEVRKILVNYPSYFEKCVYDRLSYLN